MRAATLDGLHWSLVPTSSGGSTALPVSRERVQSALRLPVSLPPNDDEHLDGLIRSAATFIEGRTRRKLIHREYDLYIDRAPCLNQLPVPVHPLASVTSIVSFGSTHDVTTMSTDDYYVDAASLPGRVVLNRGVSWPTSVRDAAGLRVRFVAGHSSDAEGIPDPLAEALLQTVAFLYEHRGEGGGAFALPPHVDELLADYIVPDVV